MFILVCNSHSNFHYRLQLSKEREEEKNVLNKILKIFFSVDLTEKCILNWKSPRSVIFLKDLVELFMVFWEQFSHTKRKMFNHRYGNSGLTVNEYINLNICNKPLDENHFVSFHLCFVWKFLFVRFFPHFFAIRSFLTLCADDITQIVQLISICCHTERKIPRQSDFCVSRNILFHVMFS